MVGGSVNDLVQVRSTTDIKHLETRANANAKPSVGQRNSPSTPEARLLLPGASISPHLTSATLSLLLSGFLVLSCSLSFQPSSIAFLPFLYGSSLYSSRSARHELAALSTGSLSPSLTPLTLIT